MNRLINEAIDVKVGKIVYIYTMNVRFRHTTYFKILQRQCLSNIHYVEEKVEKVEKIQQLC